MSSVEPPGAVRDLDWDPERARAFADGAADIWQELLERLPDLPVSRHWTAEQVREAVAIARAGRADGRRRAPRVPARRRVRVVRATSGTPGSWRTSPAPARCPASRRTCWPSGVNQNVGGWQLSPSITEIELHLMRWFAQDMFGLPEGSGGEITSGGAMANFIALKTARDHRAGWDVRTRGVGGRSAARALPVDRDPRRAATGRPTCSASAPRTCGTSRSTRLSDARRRPPRADRRRPRGGAPAVRGGGHRRHGLDRRGGPARRDRRRLRATRGSGSTSTARTVGRRCSPTTCGRCSRGSSVPTRSRSTRTSGSTRRTRVAACWCGISTDLRESFDAYASYTVQDKDAHRPRDRLRASRAALQPQRLGPEGLGVAPGARTGRVRPPDLARRGARAVPGCARRGASGLRADRPGRALDHAASATCRRGCPRRCVRGPRGVPRPS